MAHLKIHDFAQGGCEVVVVRRVLRVALDGVFVLVDGGLPVLGPERVVAPLLGRFRQLRVDVPAQVRDVEEQRSGSKREGIGTEVLTGMLAAIMHQAAAAHCHFEFGMQQAT